VPVATLPVTVPSAGSTLKVRNLNLKFRVRVGPGPAGPGSALSQGGAASVGFGSEFTRSQLQSRLPRALPVSIGTEPAGIWLLFNLNYLLYCSKAPARAGPDFGR
jgi:hypothetical protein